MPKFDKRKLTKFLNWLSAVKTWQLVGLLLIGVVLAASLLRLNNLGMIERREAVKVADESGDEEQLRGALVELQHYVGSHMNASLGSNGVALENSYNRAVEAWAKQNADQTNSAAGVYQQASVECQSQWQGNVESFRNDYVRCVAERVAALGSAEESDAGKPRPDTYQINFVSPVWSPDLAGLLVLFCIALTGVIVARVMTVVALSILLKRRTRVI